MRQPLPTIRWGAALPALLCSAAALAQPASNTSAPPPDSQSRLQALWAMLLVSLILLVLFICGALLIFRFGRWALARSRGHETTPYVDAWRQYRLSDADVEQVGGAEGDHDERA